MKMKSYLFRAGALGCLVACEDLCGLMSLRLGSARFWAAVVVGGIALGLSFAEGYETRSRR